MEISSTLWFLLARINRPLLRLEIGNLLLCNSDTDHDHACALLDCIAIAVDNDSYDYNKEKIQESLRIDFETIYDEYQESVSKYSRKFSKFPSNINKEKLQQVIHVFLEHKERESFLKSFCLECHLAEYSGVDFPEPKAPVPNSMLPTWIRYSFLEPLVPLGTNFRN